MRCVWKLVVGTHRCYVDFVIIESVGIPFYLTSQLEGVIQLMSAVPRQREVFQGFPPEMWADDIIRRLASPSSWMAAGETWRPTVAFWSLGQGLREKQRRVVNNDRGRITLWVFHGIKSRMAEILRVSVHLDQLQNGTQEVYFYYYCWWWSVFKYYTSKTIYWKEHWKWNSEYLETWDKHLNISRAQFPYFNIWHLAVLDGP